jgi:hypothetical protein
MRWMLRAMLESIFPAQPGDWTPGRLNRETYQSTVTMLKHVGLTGAAPSFETFTAQEECTRVP